MGFSGKEGGLAWRREGIRRSHVLPTLSAQAGMVKGSVEVISRSEEGASGLHQLGVTSQLQLLLVEKLYASGLISVSLSFSTGST